MKKISLPEWAYPYTKPCRYKVAYGGRGSGKTWAFAHLIAARAARENIRIGCVREFQSSIKESAKKAVEVAISRMGLADEFNIYRYHIEGKRSDSHFFFSGLERKSEEIRGWEDVDIIWAEESQRISHNVSKVLIPTIRKPGSELWFSWNPRDRSDWIYQRFIVNKQPGDLVTKVNWYDNPWFPNEANEERLYTQKYEPAAYEHIWNGEPDDEGLEKKMIPYKLVIKCIEAYQKKLHHNLSVDHMKSMVVGLDIGDTKDRSAMVVRRGPVITHAEEWNAETIGISSRKVHNFAIANEASLVNYDATGMGAGVRSYFSEFTDREYVARPELFGGEVKGAKSRYSYKVTNGQFFRNRAAQMGWNMKLRAQNTERLLAGDNVDKMRCLFINPDIASIESFKTQLAQPVYNETKNSKIEVDKYDEDNPSPNLYDACVLAFANDSNFGLKLRD